MGVHEDVRSAWGGSVPTDREGTIDDIVSVLIAEVEARKSTIRVEYESLKEMYHRGAYRSYGTKRQTEDALLKMTGQIFGMESALSVMYQSLPKRGEED